MQSGGITCGIKSTALFLVFNYFKTFNLYFGRSAYNSSGSTPMQIFSFPAAYSIVPKEIGSRTLSVIVSDLKVADPPEEKGGGL